MSGFLLNYEPRIERWSIASGELANDRRSVSKRNIREHAILRRWHLHFQHIGRNHRDIARQVPVINQLLCQVLILFDCKYMSRYFREHTRDGTRSGTDFDNRIVLIDTSQGNEVFNQPSVY